MSFELLGEAESKRLVEALVQRFGERARPFFAGKVFFARGNHAWLASKECVAFMGKGFDVQQPGLFAVTDLKGAEPSRELIGLLRALHV